MNWMFAFEVGCGLPELSATRERKEEEPTTYRETGAMLKGMYMLNSINRKSC